MQSTNPPRPRGLRLLALDDGGTRGLSELLIIQELMNRINFIDKAAVAPKPCQYFDLIGGVGTGGLIALMLGRLEMPIDRAIEAYVRFTSSVFSDKKWRSKEKFKVSVFETNMKAIIEMSGFCCELTSHKVVKARATTANPGFFEPVLITDGGIQEAFIGGNLGFNNPSKLVLEETESVFGHSAQVACLVSIGAGQLGPLSLQHSDMLNIVRKIATDTEKAAEELMSQYKHIPDVFFRLNVEQGLQNLALDDWTKLAEIKTHTHSYLLQTTKANHVNNIVQALHTSPSKISVGIFRGSVLPENHIKIFMQDIYQIPAPTRVFTGRIDILEKLNEYFATDSISKEQKRYVLYGLGGAGKTQIVLQFLALWGSSAGLQLLLFKQQEWLLVFDNADDIMLNLQPFFPPCQHGNIIITTRNKECISHAPQHNDKIEELTEEASIDLLGKICGRPEVSYEEAKLVVKELEFFPLAIIQAGHYLLQEKWSGLGQYVEKYKLNRKRFLEQDLKQHID
ncbi:hypothetical protein C0992_005186, partial [Termitomyces sp. T32_za158]